MNLTGRNIIVTGASSGIGRATAILLSKLGARLILVGRNEVELKKTADQLDGNHHVVEVFDLTQFEMVSKWLKQVVERCGKMHGLVHSAGLQVTQAIKYTSADDLRNVFAINVDAAFALGKAFRQKGGYVDKASIVFISSVSGVIGRAGIAAYSASKGAVISLTKSMALEFVRENIRVNCVAPGYVHTEMLDALQNCLTQEQAEEHAQTSPMGMGKPEDVANAIAFLLADTSSWITGTTLIVDGGCTAC